MDLATLKQHAAEIERAQRERRHKERSKLWRPVYTPVTDLGYRCERRVVYHRTQPEMALAISPELASIFTEGNLHQTDVRTELAAIGYEVVEAEVNFKDKSHQISGTIDGKVALPDPDGHHGEYRVPVEIKSTARGAPRDDDEWSRAGGLYGRYYDQLQTYLYLSGDPFGLGLFKHKITGLWGVVAVGLDYDRVEHLLQRAARIRDAVYLVEQHGPEMLPGHLPDRSECESCPYRDTVCLPSEAPVDPLLLAVDEELTEELTERESLDAERRRYKTIDDRIKTRFKNTAGHTFAVGPFVVRKKKHGKGTRIVVERRTGETQ